MTVSLLVEVPEVLHASLSAFLSEHPDWDQDRAIAAALGLFLVQSGQQKATGVYLDTLFAKEQNP